jgi:hypothetical protein
MVVVDVVAKFGVDELVKRVVNALGGLVGGTLRALVLDTLRLGVLSSGDAVDAASSVLWTVESPGTSAPKNRNKIENRTCWLRWPWGGQATLPSIVEATTPPGEVINGISRNGAHYAVAGARGEGMLQQGETSFSSPLPSVPRGNW